NSYILILHMIYSINDSSIIKIFNGRATTRSHGFNRIIWCYRVRFPSHIKWKKTIYTIQRNKSIQKQHSHTAYQKSNDNIKQQTFLETILTYHCLTQITNNSTQTA